MSLGADSVSPFSLRSMVRENGSALLKGTIWLVIVDLVGFSFPFLVKLLIDRLSENSLPNWIPRSYQDLSTGGFILCVASLYVGLSGFVAYGRYWWRVFFVWSTFPVAHRVRIQFFRHLLGLNLEFFKKNKIGDIISALSNDTENMRMVLAIGALMVIDASINFILFPIILWHLDSSLTLYVIPPLLGVALLAIFWSDRLSVQYEKVQELTASLSARAFEIASGNRIIKAFGVERSIHSSFMEESENLRGASLKVAQFQSFFVPIMDFALGIALCLVLIFGGLRVIEGTFPVSSLVAFQLYLGHLDWPMMAMGWFIQMYRSAKASEKRVLHFAETKSALQKTPELKRIPYDAHYEYRIENLSVKFSDNDYSPFENLNFQIPSKQWVGLAGPVGSGKTLLLELLSRQRDPTKGSIFYRGENLKTKSPEDLSHDILYVPQETFLFSRSLKRNLEIGLSDRLPDEDVWALLSDLQFDARVMEGRGGLETKLGERGVNLSGGQKQRLSLGRALLRRREVYLLDDLFSQVDVETESKLVRILRSRLPQNALVILASQRLETLRACSFLIVLNERGLESVGPSDDVLKTSSFLKELERIQSDLSHDLVQNVEPA